MEFIFDNDTLYNKKSDSKKYKIASMLAYSWFADVLGLIQRIKISKENADFYWSYNRFLSTNKSYILYVEHPLALFHYRLARKKFPIGTNRVKRYLSDAKLKAIVFQAKFSEETFDDLCPGYKGKKYQIYPLLNCNPYVSEQTIRDRCKGESVRILFVAQGSRFVSKCGPELLEAFMSLDERLQDIAELTVLTQLDAINANYIEKTKDSKNINWLDYKLSSKEMESLYAESSMLVVVSSDDSLNAVALEALQAGLPIIASCMSGFPEMVEEGVNGFMTEPKWWFFGKDCKPNPDVWDHREKTIYSEKIDRRIVFFKKSKITELIENREILLEFSLASYQKATRGTFSKEYIVGQWESVFRDLG